MTADRVGPLLTADYLQRIREELKPRPPHTEPDWDYDDAERWLTQLLAHAGAQDAVIANQNAEMDRLNGEVRRLAEGNERLVGEVRRVLKLYGPHEAIGLTEQTIGRRHPDIWEPIGDFPLITALLREPAQ